MGAVAFLKKYILGSDLPLVNGKWGRTSQGENFIMHPDYYGEEWCKEPLSFPQMDARLPGGFPMLLSPGEAKLLYWFIERYYTGKGEIVDLGAFLGGSALCCARGLQNNSGNFFRKERIHSYDLFRLVYDHPDFEDFYEKRGLLQNSDTLPVYNEVLGDLKEYTKTYSGSVECHKWPNKPIEMLFVDLSKSPDTDNFLVEEFFPHVSVGGFIFQQDLLAGESPWIGVTMELLKNYVRPVAAICCSVIFEVTKPIKRSIAKKLALSLLHAQQVDSLWQRWHNLHSGVGREPHYMLGRAALLALTGEPAKSAQVAAEIKLQYPNIYIHPYFQANFSRFNVPIPPI